VSNVTFIFKGSREEKDKSNIDYPKDFYYGYHNLSIKDFKKKIINLNQNYSLGIYRLLDKSIIRITNFPFRIIQILKKENIKIIKNSESVVCINETVAFSALFLLKFWNNKYKNKTYIFISMGFMAKIKKSENLSYLQRYLVKNIFEVYSKIVFVGKPEYKFAVSKYPEYSKKFVYIPFCVDTKFWKSNNEIKKKYITFIGSDENRNPDKVLQIAKELPQLDFLMVTNLINCKTDLKNVKIVNSDFHNKALSDSEIRNVYNESKLIILPLKETLQPVGQSVALQSMSMGVPVIINKTSGFWDDENFTNDKNVVLLDDDINNDWVETIIKLQTDVKLYNSISLNAKQLVNKKFNIELFTDEIVKLL